MSSKIASYQEKGYRLELHHNEDPEYSVCGSIYFLDSNGNELELLGYFEAQTIPEVVKWGLNQIAQFISDDRMRGVVNP